jgi:hypothetical protein
MLGAAHSDQRENSTDSQAVADRFRVVAAIGDDAIYTGLRVLDTVLANRSIYGFV